MEGLQHGERADVQIERGDGSTDELTVFDHVSVSRHFYINSVNGYEEFKADIAKGDDGRGSEPEAVTARVARLLYDEFRIDLQRDEWNIEVVNISDENVEVL